MTRQRLRPAHSVQTLNEIYAEPHDHTRWADHVLRVAVTGAVVEHLRGQLATVADLSCGDAAIACSLFAKSTVLGDYAPGYEHQGPLEQTIERIGQVDLFVLSETLEHLDDPDTALKAVRQKAERLLVSTPVDAFGETNPEHYWAWSRLDVEEMLRATGWKPDVYNELDMRMSMSPYCFGIWLCS